MRSTSFVAFTLCALSATVFAAPTPQLSNIIGSITSPGAGNDNLLKDNGNKNGVCFLLSTCISHPLTELLERQWQR
jgi:hypothetical protein